MNRTVMTALDVTLETQTAWLWCCVCDTLQKRQRNVRYHLKTQLTKSTEHPHIKSHFKTI